MSTSSGKELTLSVAIPTFRRVERLAALLPVVASHIEECVSAGLISEGRIIVVDNDPDRTAETTVTSFAGGSGATYISQPTPGIPAVRNAALDAAAGSRLLAFIDDDESPRPRWLAALITTWNDCGRPTGVSGLVVSHFPDGTDPWILASGLFQRSERPTGTRLPVVATGNLLLDLEAVQQFGVRFDEGMGLGGGSDTMFSTALAKRGATFVWCNESVADDPVEASRLTRAWVLRRAFSHGNVATRVALSTEPSALRRGMIRLKGVVGGAARMLVGSARRGWGRLRGDLSVESRGARLAKKGAGMVSGSFGHAFQAYAHDRKQAQTTGSPDKDKGTQ